MKRLKKSRAPADGSIRGVSRTDSYELSTEVSLDAADQEPQAPIVEPRPHEAAPSCEQNPSADHALFAVRSRLISILRITRNGHTTTLKPPPQTSPSLNPQLSTPPAQPAPSSTITDPAIGSPPFSPPLHQSLPEENLGPDLRSDFGEDLFALLLQNAEKFARKEVNAQKWRGAKGGVLPQGYDAHTIAAEAVAAVIRDFVSGRAPAHCSLTGIIEDLRTRVRIVVNRLHHRRETSLLSNAADLAPVPTEAGAAESVLEPLPTSDLGPSEELLGKEEGKEMDQVMAEFNHFLGQDQVLKDLFECLCAGITKRAAIARKLHLTPKLVTYARKRLHRRLVEFSQRKKV